jgi:fimbrial chaperone protein
MRTDLSTALRHLLLWIACAVTATGAEAGSLGVSPIRVDLSAAAPTAAITLENTGVAPMVVQLQAMRWSAVDQHDRYEATQELLVTPPIATIAPGRSQIVRLGITGTPPARREEAYRIFIEEVPPPPQAGSQTLQVSLRIGVPVFVLPPQPAPPALSWSVVVGDGAPALQVRNDGDVHSRLLDVKVRADGVAAELPVGGNGLGYLLPGQTRMLALPAQLSNRSGAGPLAVSARTEHGPSGGDVAWPAR